MKKILNTGKKGITLIELIIAAGICAIVLSAAYTVLTTGYKTYNVEFNSTVDQQNLREAMMSITKNVRNPNDIVTITSPKILTVKKGGTAQNYSVSSAKLMYGTAVVAVNISAISADFVTVAGNGSKVIQVDLTSVGGNTLSTQIQVN